MYCEGVGLGVDGGDHESYNKIKLSKGGKIYIFYLFIYLQSIYLSYQHLINPISFPDYPGILYII